MGGIALSSMIRHFFIWLKAGGILLRLESLTVRSTTSQIILGGASAGMPFFKTRPVNNFEFFPAKDRGIPRPSPLLTRTAPVNMFPRSFALPDGKVFIVSDSQSALYDIEPNTETTPSSIPNSVRIPNPYDGAATLLPLFPPLYIPEVVACGGSTARENSRPFRLSTQDLHRISVVGSS